MAALYFEFTTFLAFLPCKLPFNDKKKDCPAGHDQLAGTAKKTLGGNAEQKRPRTRDAQGHAPYKERNG
ncbi:MAG: hypothetical protein FWE28_00585 [Oscillospiraceae bacterium]|nr:hypothetical protein [Oscillospiraceae bacterium]